MKVRGFTVVGLLVALWALPAQLHAQAQGGQFAVAPRVSYQIFDNSSALDNAWMLGLDALYYFGESGFALGLTLDMSRPETQGDFFTPIRLDFGPENELHFVGVRTTLVQTSLEAAYRFGGIDRRWAPYVMAGGGVYAIYPDNQQQEGFGTVYGPAANIGAGLEFAIGEQTGFRLDVMDYVYFDYDREELNVVKEAFRDDRFPEMHGTPPDPKSTIHNIRLSLAFVFVPSR
jgi:hypothetical protein